MNYRNTIYYLRSSPNAAESGRAGRCSYYNNGHIAVVGMLLSRSTQQQHAKDWRGSRLIFI
uniref:Uncharacterized protein n=1 Tax=Meloidogyne hapla TaxID=6305 RepID=A0A1I8AZX3_MELHA